MLVQHYRLTAVTTLDCSGCLLDVLCWDGSGLPEVQSHFCPGPVDDEVEDFAAACWMWSKRATLSRLLERSERSCLLCGRFWAEVLVLRGPTLEVI
jgi:hypothetical protein